MKKTINYTLLLVCLFLTLPLQAKNHFLSDEAYRNKVHQQFLKRQKQASGRTDALFSIFSEQLTTEEREALEFLYAYMPLSDLADYDGNFYLSQVRTAFKARNYFDWGKTIPEDVFRHFVLVYRVNNENMDNAREVFFEELKDRVKGMTMEEAALEVNHWCHEKVNYRGTDSRTSAPLALIKTSWGRCGEESTLTTTAMRAVGIPARQCYTPRWAHTDDNHAWVEVWIDGKWHYIGACEPEAELDVAWFTAPSKRAMMVHTNVFGPYTGSEEKNVETDLYSVINLLSNYTDTRTATVKVINKNGDPMEGATVKFNVYNYAEFYPITTSKTTNKGKASVITGNGDVFVWATDGVNYGYAISKPSDNEIIIKLDKKKGLDYSETFVINPPVPQRIKELSPDKIAENAVRLAYEDSIRNAYMNTFIDDKYARILAQDCSLDFNEMSKYLKLAQGNWSEIACFITQEKNEPLLFPFLSSLSEKDLRDTPCAYLKDHFNLSKLFGIHSNISENLVASEIYSPRISTELIRPWRGYLQKKMNSIYPHQDKISVSQIVNYIKAKIKLDENANYYQCPISPQGLDELALGDKKSRDILFVALCRSQGIGARLEPATFRPQYYSDNDEWVNVNLNNELEVQYPKAKINFKSHPSNIVKPAYYSHYTLAKYIDGDFVTLDFENEEALKNLPGEISVDEGYYRLMIGSRANDGSVTVVNNYFLLKEGENKSVEIELPKTEGKIQVQGIVDLNSRITLSDKSETSLKDIANGKGVVICFIDPGKEPSKHILQDVPNQQNELNEWAGGILFITPDDKLNKAFDSSVFKKLPKQSLWGEDKDRKLLKATINALQLDFTDNFPLTIYLSDIGGILYSSQGYQIGIPENILKTIRTEAETKKP